MTDRVQAATAASTHLPLQVTTFLERAITVLRAESEVRDGLERLLALTPGLVEPTIHLAGEPLDVSRGRRVLRGGSDALRITAAGEDPSPAWTEAIVAALTTLAPLILDHERRTDIRTVTRTLGVEQGGLLGVTPVMRQLHERIARAARKPFIVLVEGESGAGKELVARRVHALSDRASGPFVPLNCAAIVESLLEAELFGIEERTATGVRGRRGKFEIADGGTLFLDEVSDLSTSAQAKLLRVIQEPTIERVGGHGGRRVDVRVIAATNRPLEGLCRRGEFRWDLYYRLNAIEISVPPLRARRDDIPYLVEAILQRSCDGPAYRVSPEAMEALRLHEWPGNVRELERVIERAVTLAQSHVIQVDDLPQTVTGRYRDVFLPGEQAGDTMRAWGSRYARYVLARAQGNKREACRVLDISYHTLCAYLAYEPPSEPRYAGAPLAEALGSSGRAGHMPFASPAYGPAALPLSTLVHEGRPPGLDT